MSLDQTKSRALEERFDAVYASAHSNFKRSIAAGGHKLFIEKAEAGRVWDVDGHEFVDWVGALGPLILGHRHPEIVESLKSFLDTQGTTLGSGIYHTEEDIQVAEMISRFIPCAEKVKTCTSGSEAIQLAIRLSRAHTKRPRFIRFQSHYHGWIDNVVIGRHDKQTTGRPFPTTEGEERNFYSAEGNSPTAGEESFILPWNDIEALEKTLQDYGDEVAMIICEAFGAQNMCRSPLPGFLERVRELCTEYGVVLCFDEIVTGFRIGLGGAQEYYGVTPDMAVVGKAIAAGLPFAAVVGKAEIMELLADRRVLGPGTFNGYPLGMHAALATLSILSRDNGAAYRHRNEIQARLSDGLHEVARNHNQDLAIQESPGSMSLHLGLKEGTVFRQEADLVGFDRKRFFQLQPRFYDEGIMIMPDKLYVSVAHTHEDADQTVEAFDRILKVI